MAVSENSSSKLRACLNCAIIQSTLEFRNKGCPNCPFLNTNKEKNMQNTTSPSFRGMIAQNDPKRSWVSKWHRISHYTPGIYAMTVEGVLSEHYINEIEKDGRVYVNRSNSFEI